MDHYIYHYNGATMDAWGPTLAENLIIELTFNDRILESINEDVAAPAAEKRIAENTALGLPAQELYDVVQRILSEDS
ncbi:MAG: hypothetical protein AAFQ09_12890 [Pseudomonadota bacterium]